MPDPNALIAHIVSQTRQNIEFLISQNGISSSAGRDILSKLPSPSTPHSSINDSSILALSDATRRMTIPEPSPTPSSIVSPPRSSYASPSPPDFGPPVRRNVPPPQPQPRVARAKALWSYNENGEDPNDLSFRGGDIIEIVTETNADWWTGKLNGRQGLFPSNYVEKLDSSISAPPYPPPDVRSPSSYNAPPQSSYNTPPPSSYNSSPMPYHAPPPPGQVAGYNPYMNGPGQGQVVHAPPPQQQQVVVQEQQQPQKESKYGGLKQTLATSAVGGVGFGAGSAIGSGLINSIF